VTLHVLLTCPPAVLCNIGLEISSDEQEDTLALAALHELGGEVTQTTNRVAVVLPDPADAILAMRQLVMELPDFEVELVSFVASAVAGDLLAENVVPVRDAWLWMRARVQNQPPDPGQGCFVIARRELPHAYPVPPVIADQALPAAPGMLLWSTRTESVVRADQVPFVVAPELQPGMTVWIDDGHVLVVLRA